MNIILKKLTLENFKGIKNRVIEFNEDITTILGENATGKTTIFDGFSWLLWNKDSLDKADFNIKTIGEDGQYIRNLEHLVEAEFTLIDNNEKEEKLILKKVLKEDWGTKRGNKKETFNGNNTEYFINNLKVKLKEFTKRIETLITNEQFKQLSNPLHFNTNLKTKEKRPLILSLVNTVTEEEIIDKNKELEPLRELFKTYKIEEILAINKDRKSETNKRLEVLPIKINERHASKKELDFKELEAKKKIINKTIDKIDKDLSKQDNTAALKDKQKQLRNLTIEQENIIADVEKQNRDNKRKYEENIETKARNINVCEKKIKILVEGKEKTIPLLKHSEENLEKLRNKYVEFASKENNEEVETICPTCGQKLPLENIKKQRNLVKSNMLEKMTEEGELANESVEVLKSDIVYYDEEIKKYTEKLEQVQRDFPSEPTEILIPQEYNDIAEQLKILEKEIKDFDVTDNTKIIDKKKELQEELGEIESQLVYKLVNKEADEKIAEYETEQKQLAEEFDAVEKMIYLCEEFSKAKVEYISDDINSMFELVKFKLFETQINGGINEVCEATVDNVPFSDLNNAMKINAGIDIINTLSEHYGIKAPIFIDNAESVNLLEPTESQVIRLVVSNDKELVIK